VQAGRSSPQPSRSQQPEQQHGAQEALPRTGSEDLALALLGIGCLVMGWGMTALAEEHGRHSVGYRRKAETPTT
jgi:LPXTG-motif cell wall-anchored protein